MESAIFLLFYPILIEKDTIDYSVITQTEFTCLAFLKRQCDCRLQVLPLNGLYPK